MKNIVHRDAGCEAGGEGENCPRQQFDPNRLFGKGENRALVHHLVDQPRHVAFFGLPFFVLIERSNAFGKVTFAVAMQLRPVFILAKVRDDVFTPDFKIQV